MCTIKGEKRFLKPLSSIIPFVLLLMFLLPFAAIAQRKPKKSAINTTSVDTLRSDSSKVIEDAPLDIAQNRGIFIVSPDRMVQLRILGSVRYLIVYDQLDLTDKNSFSTYGIPMGALNQTLPNYYNGLSQSRLGFEVTRKTDDGNVFVRLETDFAGANGFRIRHAYGQYGRGLVGQTWSLFSQINVMPSTVDFSGPTGGVSLRTPQIRYSAPKPILGMRFAASLEYVFPDFTIPDSLAIKTFQLVPDLVVRFDQNFDWGYWQVSGILPFLSARAPNSELIIKTGWGVASSVSLKSWLGGRWFLQETADQGITRFINDISGNGLDVLIDFTASQAYLPTSLGGYIGYEHTWKKGLSSNILYGAASVQPAYFTSPDSFLWGQTLRTNTFWDVVEGSKLGMEVIWGQRFNKDMAADQALRLNVLFYYDF